jgi:hypothetical protein
MENSYRENDYDILLKLYEEINKTNNSIINKAKKLFNVPINSFDDIKNNKIFIFKHIKNETELHENDFNILLENILTRNNKYYKECFNISFTDLLLVDNINKFIGLTGTSYIFLPEQIIDGQRFIQGIDETNVEAEIKNIILDKNRFKKFLIHDGSIDDYIFSIIKDYSVLIDIAGVFVNYNIKQFIKKYREVDGRKKNIIYFDNGIKLYNLDENYIDILGSNICNDCFFYFSNKNITGVDAKSYMPLTAHGLVTISNNTLIRDFSQGIYRMRNIKDSQTVDFIMLEKSFNIKLKDKLIQKPNIRKHLINMLKSNQILNDNNKIKLLNKQNIFGLSKYNNVRINYDTNIRNFKIKLYENILETGADVNIDLINIDDEREKIISNKILYDLCKDLRDYYTKTKMDINDIKIAQSIQQQQQEEISLELNTNIQLDINDNIEKRNNKLSIKKTQIQSITSNFSLSTSSNEKYDRDYAIILYNKSYKTFIYALYDVSKNILFLVDKIYLYKIIHFISNTKNNILLFDYNSDIIYGQASLPDIKKKSISIMIKDLISKYKSELEYDKDIYYTMEENKLIEKDTVEKIINDVIFVTNLNENSKWRKKYLKYKQKYLNLLNS